MAVAAQHVERDGKLLFGGSLRAKLWGLFANGRRAFKSNANTLVVLHRRCYDYHSGAVA